MFAESNGPLGSVQRAADAIRDSTSKDAEPNALRNVRLALLSLPRDSSNVPDVPEVRILREFTSFSSSHVSSREIVGVYIIRSDCGLTYKTCAVWWVFSGTSRR